MTPMPGDFFLSHYHTEGFLDKILSGIASWGTQSSFVHSGIYVGREFGHDDPQVIEARPGGVGFKPFDVYMNAYWSTSYIELSEQQRGAIIRFAGECVGMKYAVTNFIPLALAQSRAGRLVKADRAISEQPFWVRKLLREDRFICSKLVAMCYGLVGVVVAPGIQIYDMVTTADLMRYLYGKEASGVVGF